MRAQRIGTVALAGAGRPRGRGLISGALAGTATAFAFTALHHLLISDIWFSLVPMLAAGAICGLCLAWSYRSLAAAPSAHGWMLYNLMYVGLFVLLGALSFLLYEPVYHIPALVAGEQPPGELLRQAMPLTIAFALGAALVISLARARTLRQATSITLTSLALTVLLGHNAAILGMVHMTQEALPLLAQFYGMIAFIMVGNALFFWLLERRGTFSGALMQQSVLAGEAVVVAVNPSAGVE